MKFIKKAVEETLRNLFNFLNNWYFNNEFIINSYIFQILILFNYFSSSMKYDLWMVLILGDKLHNIKFMIISK